MKRDDLVVYLDGYLGARAMQDYSMNGLQVEGADEIERLALAVDTNLQTIDGAVAARAQMLIVHHGLFWGKPLPIIGPHRRRVQALLSAGCSLYACHLPLDRHPEVGNNAQLAAQLGLCRIGEFGEAFGVPIGIIGEAPEGMTLAELAASLERVTGARPLVLPGGPAIVKRVAILSGDGAREIPTAVAAGCDTYVTGEHRHTAYPDAAEYGINVVYGGHYATETVGVKALGQHLAHKLGVPAVFIDHPTGM